MPALYIGHGAPPLLDDPLWTAQLRSWADALPRPRAILIVSAHWETAPAAISSTDAATKVMYPDAAIPVLQLSIPSHDPQALLDLGQRLRPLREHGVLVIGSGFLTHGLPYLRDWSTDAQPPGWSRDFDLWAAEALDRGDVDTLASYASAAPGMPYAHPTVEHFVPLFITLGSATDPAAAPGTVIDGYFFGLAKRSFQVA
jgi:4,5-DOPA dioxygenase extradiol